VPSGSETTAASAAGASAARGPAADEAPRGTERPQRPGRLRRLRQSARREAPRTGGAVAAGVALGLAFPPYGLWPLSPLAVAALSVLTRARRPRQGAWTGLAFGFPFFVVLLKWLHVVGWDAVLGLSLLQALFLAALGAALAVSSRLPGWPLWGACLWVAEEWARDRVPFGGFPWGRLAFANTGSPFTPLAALGGAPAVTFAVALSGTLLAAAALSGWRLRRAPEPADAASAPSASTPSAGATREHGPGPDRSRYPVFAAPAGALLLAIAVAAAGYAVPLPTKADDSADVAVVQGNVEKAGMDFLGRPMKILNNHSEATVDLARKVKAGRAHRPDLVIWPENSSDLDPFKFPQAGDRIEKAVRAIDVPVLVGALIDDTEHPGYIDNEGIVWDPKKGPGASYTKQHPVPFGEYVPFRKELSTVFSRLNRIPHDFRPGDHTGVLRLGPARLGDVICFEIAYDEIPRDTVNAGGRALVVQTNNATYGGTGEPEQQLAMSRLRAIEHGRAVVTAATSGISAFVTPDGRIEQRSREFTRDVLQARLPLRDETTLADRVGAAPEWALAMVGLLSCAGGVLAGRRGRSGGGTRQAR